MSTPLRTARPVEYAFKRGDSPLLGSLRIAEFLARGFLVLEGVVPEDVNARVLEVLRERTEHKDRDPLADVQHPLVVSVQHYPWKALLSQCFGREPHLKDVLLVPEVRGMIESLVGPDPYYDHHAVHVAGAGMPAGNLHADVVIDTRAAFDVNLMYYPQGVSEAGGPTLVIPGSHFRQINSLDIARYQNLAGQAFLACEPGTVVALHHGLWHCGSRNSTDAVRYMVKIRLDPRLEQVRLWDTSDLTDPDVRNGVQQMLDMAEPWYESSAVFLEKLQRTALFRRLSGDADFGEVEPWLGRLENQPLPRLRDLLP
jgi:hypothetical protein